MFIVVTHSLILPRESWGLIEFESWLLLQGRLIYRDWFDFITPGAQLIGVPFVYVFGATPASVCTEVIVVVVVIAVQVYRVGRELFELRVAAIAVCLWAAWAPMFKSDVLWHNLLLIPFYLESLLKMHAAISGAQTRRSLFWCGLICGAAFLVKQHAAFMLLAAVLAWSLLRIIPNRVAWLTGIVWLACGAGSILVLFFLFFAHYVPSGVLFYDLILYPLKDAHVNRWNELPRRVLLLVLPLFAFCALYFARAFANRNMREPRRRAILLCLWWAAAILNIAHSVRLELLATAVPMTVVTAAALLDDACRHARAARGAGSMLLAVATAAAIAVMTSLCMYYYLIPPNPAREFLESRLWRWYDAGVWVRTHTSRDKHLFVFGAPAVYFGALRLPATPHLILEPSERSIRNLETDVIRSLASDVSAGVVYAPTPHVPFDKLHWDDHWTYAQIIQQYILVHYREVQKLPGGLIYMERNADN